MELRLPTINNLRPIIEVHPRQTLYTARKYYSKIFKIPYLKRLKMVVKLLENKKYNCLLDLGFGSGFLLPELSCHCNNLYGIDLHKDIPLVKDMLHKESIDAKILSGNILNLPFKKEFFDCIVCLSVLEFIDDIESSILEINRIAKKNATIIIGAPILNKITGICYDRLLKLKHHHTLHKSNHLKIINFVNKYLNIEKILVYPFFLPMRYALFFVLKARKG